MILFYWLKDCILFFVRILLIGVFKDSLVILKIIEKEVFIDKN